MMYIRAFLCLLVLSLTSTFAYKDVVFIHGILAGPEEFDDFTKLIQEQHPGQRVYAPSCYDDYMSIAPLWDQVAAFVEKVKPILTNKSSEGTVLVSFSQGGMISRGILSVLEHNVETYISLSGPLAGQYGDTKYMEFFFPKYVTHNAYLFFYTDEGQKTSVGNYWNDPHQQDLYRNFSRYLGVLNNETNQANPESEVMKANFMRLKNIMLVGGPDDGVIQPWQSSHFGFFDENEEVQPMTEFKWYQNDAFGLKTLDAAGKIHTATVANISHTHWHKEKEIFDKYIMPWL